MDTGNRELRTDRQNHFNKLVDERADVAALSNEVAFGLALSDWIKSRPVRESGAIVLNCSFNSLFQSDNNVPTETIETIVLLSGNLFRFPEFIKPELTGKQLLAKRDSFLMRLDPKILAAVRRWADDDLRSVNAQLEFILRRALRESGRLTDSSQSEHGKAPSESAKD